MKRDGDGDAPMPSPLLLLPFPSRQKGSESLTPFFRPSSSDGGGRLSKKETRSIKPGRLLLATIPGGFHQWEPPIIVVVP
ncbi:hypothetical protein Lalb_Chr22g0359171 [Lupinus albus]|uniref:Uncharacterized protein n=1 Tax=Lupinus albus TaxID=3870 RepID=A0A6A4N2D3_LUPAL|nr:hypothetical protein Lalb_Chr22g0359171 [Lupinus albus]